MNENDYGPSLKPNIKRKNGNTVPNNKGGNVRFYPDALTMSGTKINPKSPANLVLLRKEEPIYNKPANVDDGDIEEEWNLSMQNASQSFTPVNNSTLQTSQPINNLNQKININDTGSNYTLRQPSNINNKMPSSINISPINRLYLSNINEMIEFLNILDENWIIFFNQTIDDLNKDHNEDVFFFETFYNNYVAKFDQCWDYRLFADNIIKSKYIKTPREKSINDNVRIKRSTFLARLLITLNMRSGNVLVNVFRIAQYWKLNINPFIIGRNPVIPIYYASFQEIKESSSLEFDNIQSLIRFLPDDSDFCPSAEKQSPISYQMKKYLLGINDNNTSDNKPKNILENSSDNNVSPDLNSIGILRFDDISQILYNGNVFITPKIISEPLEYYDNSNILLKKSIKTQDTSNNTNREQSILKLKTKNPVLVKEILNDNINVPQQNIRRNRVGLININQTHNNNSNNNSETIYPKRLDNHSFDNRQYKVALVHFLYDNDISEFASMVFENEETFTIKGAGNKYNINGSMWDILLRTNLSAFMPRNQLPPSNKQYDYKSNIENDDDTDHSDHIHLYADYLIDDRIDDPFMTTIFKNIHLLRDNASTGYMPYDIPKIIDRVIVTRAPTIIRYDDYDPKEDYINILKCISILGSVIKQECNVVVLGTLPCSKFLINNNSLNTGRFENLFYISKDSNKSDNNNKPNSTLFNNDQKDQISRAKIAFDIGYNASNNFMHSSNNINYNYTMNNNNNKEGGNQKTLLSQYLENYESEDQDGQCNYYFDLGFYMHFALRTPCIRGRIDFIALVGSNTAKLAFATGYNRLFDEQVDIILYGSPSKELQDVDTHSDTYWNLLKKYHANYYLHRTMPTISNMNTI